MRVTVQIDDDRPAAAATPEAERVTPSPAPSGGGSTPPEVPAAVPSPELAARAARLGALSAGPAPSAPPGGAAGAPGFLVEGLVHPPAGSPGAAQDAPADHSAGPAPTATEGDR